MDRVWVAVVICLFVVVVVVVVVVVGHQTAERCHSCELLRLPNHPFIRREDCVVDLARGDSAHPAGRAVEGCRVAFHHRGVDVGILACIQFPGQ